MNSKPRHRASVEEALARLQQYARTLIDYAQNVHVLIEIGRERGIEVDLSGAEEYRRFQDDGGHFTSLIMMRSDLSMLSSILDKHGIKATLAETDAKKREMFPTTHMVPTDS